MPEEVCLFMPFSLAFLMKLQSTAFPALMLIFPLSFFSYFACVMTVSFAIGVFFSAINPDVEMNMWNNRLDTCNNRWCSLVGIGYRFVNSTAATRGAEQAPSPASSLSPASSHCRWCFGKAN